MIRREDLSISQENSEDDNSAIIDEDKEVIVVESSTSAAPTPTSASSTPTSSNIFSKLHVTSSNENVDQRKSISSISTSSPSNFLSSKHELHVVEIEASPRTEKPSVQQTHPLTSEKPLQQSKQHDVKVNKPITNPAYPYWNQTSFYSTLGVYYHSLPFPTSEVHKQTHLHVGSRYSSLISSLLEDEEEDWEDSSYVFSDDWYVSHFYSHSSRVDRFQKLIDEVHANYKSLYAFFQTFHA